MKWCAEEEVRRQGGRRVLRAEGGDDGGAHGHMGAFVPFDCAKPIWAIFFHHMNVGPKNQFVE